MAVSTNLSLCIMVLAVCAVFVATEAQSVPSCANNLAPCVAVINATKPPETCCKPLNETITTQLECLCNLYKNPELLKSYGVNLTDAVTLPARCGISAESSSCSNAQSPASSTTPPPPAGNGEKIAATGFLGLVVVLVSFLLI